MRNFTPDSTRRTFFSFAGIASIRGLTAISQLMIIAAASQIFEKDQFGRFALAYALARLLQAGSGLGAQSYLLKDIPYRQVHNRPWHSVRSAGLIFVISPLGICAIAGAIFECLAALNAPFYPLLAGQGAAVAVFAYLWTILATLASYVRTLRSSGEAMLLSELAVPAALLVTMSLGWLSGDVSIIWLLTCAGLLLFLGELVLLGWHVWSPWLPVGGPNGEAVPLKELKAYWGTVLLNTMAAQLDIVLAGTVLSPAVVGLYTIIKRMANVITLAMSVVVWMYAPKISRASAASNNVALSYLARRAILYTLGPATIILILLIASLPWWTAYFEIATDSTFWALLVLMLGTQILSIMMGSTMMFATQTGRPQLMIRSLLRAIAIAAPLTLLGGTTIGIVGVALAQFLMIFLIKRAVRRSLLEEQDLDISVMSLFKRPPSGIEAGAKD